MDRRFNAADGRRQRHIRRPRPGRKGFCVTVPENWDEYSTHKGLLTLSSPSGSQIIRLGGIIPCKTFLGSAYDSSVPRSSLWHPTDLNKTLKSCLPNEKSHIVAVVNLCLTERHYSPADLQSKHNVLQNDGDITLSDCMYYGQNDNSKKFLAGEGSSVQKHEHDILFNQNTSSKTIEYYWFKVNGGGELPVEETIGKFLRLMFYLGNRFPDDGIVVLHCTHGVNRTGLFSVLLLVLCKQISVADALSEFKEARGYGIEREELLSFVSSYIGSNESLDVLRDRLLFPTIKRELLYGNSPNPVNSVNSLSLIMNAPRVRSFPTFVVGPLPLACSVEDLYIQLMELGVASVVSSICCVQSAVVLAHSTGDNSASNSTAAASDEMANSEGADAGEVIEHDNVVSDHIDFAKTDFATGISDHNDDNTRIHKDDSHKTNNNDNDNGNDDNNDNNDNNDNDNNDNDNNDNDNDNNDNDNDNNNSSIDDNMNHDNNTEVENNDGNNTGENGGDNISNEDNNKTTNRIVDENRAVITTGNDITDGCSNINVDVMKNEGEELLDDGISKVSESPDDIMLLPSLIVKNGIRYELKGSWLGCINLIDDGSNFPLSGLSVKRSHYPVTDGTKIRSKFISALKEEGTVNIDNHITNSELDVCFLTKLNIRGDVPPSPFESDNMYKNSNNNTYSNCNSKRLRQRGRFSSSTNYSHHHNNNNNNNNRGDNMHTPNRKSTKLNNVNQANTNNADNVKSIHDTINNSIMDGGNNKPPPYNNAGNNNAGWNPHPTIPTQRCVEPPTVSSSSSSSFHHRVTEESHDYHDSFNANRNNDITNISLAPFMSHHNNPPMTYGSHHNNHNNHNHHNHNYNNNNNRGQIPPHLNNSNPSYCGPPLPRPQQYPLEIPREHSREFMRAMPPPQVQRETMTPQQVPRQIPLHQLPRGTQFTRENPRQNPRELMRNIPPQIPREMPVPRQQIHRQICVPRENNNNNTDNTNTNNTNNVFYNNNNREYEEYREVDNTNINSIRGVRDGYGYAGYPRNEVYMRNYRSMVYNDANDNNNNSSSTNTNRMQTMTRFNNNNNQENSHNILRHDHQHHQFYERRGSARGTTPLYGTASNMYLNGYDNNSRPQMVAAPNNNDSKLTIPPPTGNNNITTSPPFHSSSDYIVDDNSNNKDNRGSNLPASYIPLRMDQSGDRRYVELHFGAQRQYWG